MREFKQWVASEIKVAQGQEDMYPRNSLDNEFWRGLKEGLELAQKKYAKFLEAQPRTGDKVKHPRLDIKGYISGDPWEDYEEEVTKYYVVWENGNDEWCTPDEFVVLRESEG